MNAIDGIPRYIAIEGPIGVGKTTLAGRLAATYGADLIKEAAEDNPFLPRFYEDPKKSALPTQLYFLFQRVQQVQAMRQNDMFSPVRVADFMMEKDRLFAEITLGAEELKLYYQVYEQMTIDAPPPDLVIYLQAPVDVLMTRISKRGIPYERGIEESYLQQLSDAYIDFFYHYNETSLLIVNAADINLATSDEDYAFLLQRLGEITSGRHFLNPIHV